MKTKLKSAHRAWRRFENAHWRKVNIALLAPVVAWLVLGWSTMERWELVFCGALLASLLVELLYRSLANHWQDLYVRTKKVAEEIADCRDRAIELNAQSCDLMDAAMLEITRLSAKCGEMGEERANG